MSCVVESFFMLHAMDVRAVEEAHEPFLHHLNVTWTNFLAHITIQVDGRMGCVSHQLLAIRVIAGSASDPGRLVRIETACAEIMVSVEKIRPIPYFNQSK